MLAAPAAIPTFGGDGRRRCRQRADNEMLCRIADPVRFSDAENGPYGHATGIAVITGALQHVPARFQGSHFRRCRHADRFRGRHAAYLRFAAPEARVTDEDFLAAYRYARADGKAGWYRDDLERCWHAIAPKLGLPDTDALAQGLRDSVARWPAFPDSVEALKRLGKRFKLVTMTNAQQWALAHFDKTLGPLRHAARLRRRAVREARCALLRLCRGRFEGAWGYKQADNLHVAQSQYHDIGISKQLGITTCWIERRHGTEGLRRTIESEHTEPDYHFHTLAELADAVEAGR